MFISNRFLLSIYQAGASPSRQFTRPRLQRQSMGRRLSRPGRSTACGSPCCQSATPTGPSRTRSASSSMSAAYWATSDRNGRPGCSGRGRSGARPEANGQESQTTFGTRLTERGFEKSRPTSGPDKAKTVYKGIGLNAAASQGFGLAAAAGEGGGLEDGDVDLPPF